MFFWPKIKLFLAEKWVMPETKSARLEIDQTRPYFDVMWRNAPLHTCFIRSNLIHCWQRFFDPIFLFQFSKVLTKKPSPKKFWKNLNIGRYQNFRVKVDPVPISVTLNPDTDGPPLTSVIFFQI